MKDLKLTRGMSRRDFMQRAMASGITVAGASAMWATQSAAQTPRAGGHFRVGHGNGNSNDVLDPAKMVSEFQSFLNFTMRNHLVELDPENNLIPELAESWEGSPDAKVWRFKIRPGVSFHSGKTLDAEDVAATFRYHRDPQTASNVASLLAAVDDISTEGDTVIFTLSGGNADFPYILSDWHFTILPVKDGTLDAASGDGTGGYVLDSHDPGVRTEFSKNPDYWKDGRAHFDRVTVNVINDSAARQNALITGEVDAIDNLDPKTLSLLERQNGVVVEDVPSGAHMTMPMHVDKAPFDDPDVRRALKLAMNREQMLQTILQSRGTLGNDHPVGSVMPFWADLPQRAYDPEEARFHLKKAGAEGLSISLSAADAAFTGAVDMASLYAEQAKAAGINVKVERKPNDGYWSEVWLKDPFCMCFWSGRPTPDAILSLAYAANSDFNDTRFADERFNELLVAARAEIDEARRAEMYAEMQQILHDDGGTIVPMFRNWLFATADTVAHGPSMTGNITLDGGRAAERWWFTS